MEAQCERPTAFSLHSIFNQVLKPLDVKTKFYNAEVSSVLRLRHENHVILQIDIVCEMWFLYQSI